MISYVYIVYDYSEFLKESTVDITTESIRNGKVIAIAEGMSKKAAKLEDNKVS